MAKKIQTKTDSDDLALSVNDNSSGSGNIDNIREILFGVQMRNFEKRFQKIEERMAKELKEIRENLKKDFSSMESYVKQEIDAISDSLDIAKEERGDIEIRLNKELTASSHALEKKLSKVDDQLTKNSREIRQQILDHSKTLSEEIRQRYEDNAMSLEQTAEELNANKADNAAIAEMLTDMAMRLTNDPAMKLNLTDLQND